MTPDEVVSKFPNTVKALAVWEAQIDLLWGKLEAAQTNEEVAAWDAEVSAADDKLRDAFWEDTKGYNSRAHISHMTAKHIHNFIETGSFR